MDLLEYRMIERIAIVFFGGLSIYLGYRLFQYSDQAPGDGSFQFKDVVKIGLKSVAPGVFFAMFGAWILYSSINARIEVGDSGGRGEPLAALSLVEASVKLRNLETRLNDDDAVATAELIAAVAEIRGLLERQTGRVVAGRDAFDGPIDIGGFLDLLPGIATENAIADTGVASGGRI